MKIGEQLADEFKQIMKELNVEKAANDFIEVNQQHVVKKNIQQNTNPKKKTKNAKINANQPLNKSKQSKSISNRPKIAQKKHPKKLKKESLDEERILKLQDYRMKIGLHRLSALATQKGFDYCSSLTITEINQSNFSKKKKQYCLSHFEFAATTNQKPKLASNYSGSDKNQENQTDKTQSINKKETQSIKLEQTYIQTLNQFRLLCGLAPIAMNKKLRYVDCYCETLLDILDGGLSRKIYRYFRMHFYQGQTQIDESKLVAILPIKKWQKNQAAGSHNSTANLKRSLNQLETFRRLCGLSPLSSKLCAFGYQSCVVQTKQDLLIKNYPQKLIDYFVASFIPDLKKLDWEYIKLLLSVHVEQLAPQQFVKINNKQYIFKQIIVNGFVESIPIELGKELIEQNQYDYYNSDNNMYDNLDYRHLQDQFDLLGISENHIWD